MSDTDDEENGGTVQRGRPNAYFAQIRTDEEEKIQAQERGDTFSGAFRGTKPVPHGGTAAVRPDQVLGTEDLCWCGQPLGHDWPGKSVGAKHPKNVEESREVSSQRNETMPALDRRDLRAFHRRLQDFILSCINEGVRYRLTKNSIILYAPDGTTPMSVYARNTDRQLRQLQRWYIDHVYVEPTEEEPVDAAKIQELAKAKNDPVEHPTPAKEEFRPTAKVSDGPTRKPVDNIPAEATTPESYRHEELPILIQPEGVSTDGEWVPYVRSDGTISERIITNGSRWRCIECVDSAHPLDSDNIRSVGGHNRMYHTDTTNMRDEVARSKATETRRANLLSTSSINQAIELLIGVTGYEVQPAEDLRPELEKVSEDLVAMTKRAEIAEAKLEEIEAKLALIREATGL